MPLKMIEHEIGLGKTIKALEFLHANGGGIYIGSGESEQYIASLIKKHDLKNIQVLIVPPDLPIAIDNVERFNLVVTKTKRKPLG